MTSLSSSSFAPAAASTEVDIRGEVIPFLSLRKKGKEKKKNEAKSGDQVASIVYDDAATRFISRITGPLALRLRIISYE